MICNEVVKQVDSIKYLGVIKIIWSQQVDKIVLKANRVRGFLYCNIKHCSLDIKTDVTKYFFSQYWSMHRLYGPLTIINI